MYMTMFNIKQYIKLISNKFANVYLNIRQVSIKIITNIY